MEIGPGSPIEIGFASGVVGGVALGSALLVAGVICHWSGWIVGALPVGAIGGGVVGAILGALYTCQKGKSLQGRIVVRSTKDPITDGEL